MFDNGLERHPNASPIIVQHPIPVDLAMENKESQIIPSKSSSIDACSTAIK